MNKEKFTDIFLINSFILHFFASMISNYSETSLIIKSITLTLLLIGVALKIKYSDLNLEVNIFDQKFLFIVLGIIIYPAITLIYSSNFSHGINKLIHFLIGPIFSIITLKILVSSLNQETQIIFKQSIIFISLLIVLLVLVIHPFKYSTSYNFQFGRWSHVIVGRFLSLAFVITVLINYRNINKGNIFSEQYKIYIRSIIPGIIFGGLFITQFRAGLLGAILIILFGIVYLSFKQVIKLKEIILFTIATLMVITLFNFPQNNFEMIPERYEKLVSSEYINDPSVSTRIDAIEISLEMFQEKPLFGQGFGGFNQHYKSKLPQEIKYPHNIILEITVEFGLIGLLIYSSLFILLTIYLWCYSKLLLIFFLFSFWLSLFSKDYSTNTQLWIILSLLFFSKNAANNSSV